MNKKLITVVAVATALSSMPYSSVIAQVVPGEESQQVQQVAADPLKTTSPDLKVTKGVVTEGDFSCKIENGQAREVKFVGESADGVVTFPEKMAGYPVTSIASYALSKSNTYGAEYKESVKNIKEVILPQTVEVIGERAFASCYALEKMNMPCALKEIGNQSFISTALTRLDFSQTQLETIGEYAFLFTNQLKEIKFPTTLKTVKKYGLAQTDGVESIDLGGTQLETIEEGAFYSTSAKKVILPDSVKFIGKAAFNEDLSLEYVNLETLNQLKEIGPSAFYECPKLVAVSLPEGLEQIDESAFGDCENMKQIILPKSFKKAGAGQIFSMMTKLLVYPDSYGLSYAKENQYDYEIIDEVDESQYSYEIQNDEAVHVKYVGEVPQDGRVVFPAKLGGKPVTSIGSYALSSETSYNDAYKADVKEVKIVILPDTVRSIEDRAFVSCYALEEISAPQSLESIGNQVFNGSALKNLDFSSTKLKKIGDYAFVTNTHLTSLRLPDTFESFGKYALANTSALESLDFSNTKVKDLGEAVFYRSGIKTMSVPATLDKVELGAFGYLLNLDVLDLSKTSLKNVGESMCQCSNMKEIILPSTVIRISNYAFAECNELTDINVDKLPELKEISFRAFYKSGKIKHIVLPEGMTTIGRQCFDQCTALETVQLPKTFQSGKYTDYFPKTTLLRVYKDSEGLTFAQKNGYKYEVISEVDESLYTYEVMNDEAVHVKYIGKPSEEGVVIFPETLGGKVVTSIAPYALSSEKDYTPQYKNDTNNVIKVILPDTVKIIEDRAFVSCYNLEEINVPAALESIGNQSFISAKLKTLDFRQSQLKTVGEYAFLFNENLTSIYFPSSLCKIGNYALAQTPLLTMADLSQTQVVEIPDTVFYKSGIQTVK